MLVTLSGIVTLVSPLQPENAEFLMFVTLSGIVTLSSSLQEKNALSPMLVTVLPPSMDGIVTTTVGDGEMAAEPLLEISAVSPVMLYVHV